MASELDNLVAAHVRPTLLAQLGQEATYTPAAGVAKAVRVILTDGPGRQTREESDGQSLRANANAWLSTDAAEGIPAPVEGDTLTIDGRTFVVTAILATVGGMAQLTIEQAESTQRARRSWPIRRF